MKAEDLATVERAIIGSVLLDPERCLPLAVREGVALDWFTDERRRLMWDAITTLWAERSPVDALAVIERAGRLAAEPKSRHAGVSLSAGEVQQFIDDTPTSTHFEHYMRLGLYETMCRRVKKAGAAWNDALSDGVPVSEATQELAEKITRILSAGSASKSINIAEQLEIIRREYDAAHQKRTVEKDLEYTPGIPLPWKEPNIASQGVQEGLYYLGARPSVGKTAFMLNLVRFWCERGVRVAFNSLDMAVKPMLKRPIAELARVSLMKSSFGTTNHEDIEANGKAIEKIKTWPWSLLQERDVDVFRSWCLAAHASGKLDVAVVDFVQLMTTRHRYSNDNEKLEYISGVLKSIAIDLDIPVIALSQLNRACEEDGGRIPTASDLRGSGALEQDATAVWILHRDRDVIKTWEDTPATKPLALVPSQNPADAEKQFKGVGPVRFIIAKNQNGQAGQDVWFPFIFYKKYCLFMLADMEAAPITTCTGAGATRREVKEYYPRYARVSHDWRCDPFEKNLLESGALCGYDLRTMPHLN